MADPKYIGLPGIVYDQPDVYETNELPESEQEIHEVETGDSNPAFEVLHISGTEAFDKFKGKSINTTDVDFSDRISRKRGNGYRSNLPIEWNVVCDGEEETLVQKYQRLQCEVDNLQREIQQMEGNINHGDGSVSVVDLSKSVAELHSTLNGLNLEESLGKDIISSIAEPEVILQKKLHNLLERLKEKSQEDPAKKGDGGKDGSAPSKDGHGATYELFYAPEHVKFNRMSRASHIEKRLDHLESLVGNNSEKLCSLSTWTNHKSLLGAVEVLSSRLALLEPGHLDHIEGRLHSVHTRMNSITEKKAAIEDADKQSKVNELYEVMKKCEVMCMSLPEVVDRLMSVESLHHEASQFNRLVKQLDAAQTELSATLQTNGVLLSSLQEKFLHNLQNVQSNMEALDQRIQKLPEKK